MTRNDAVAEAPDGEVGRVAAVKGIVWVKGAGGEEGKVAEGDSLRRSDALRPESDGFIVILLKNNHVVKITAPMPVAKIAVLDAPELSTDLEQALRNQLGAEYEGMIGKDKLQRIAGWNQSMAAGDVVAPEQKREERPVQPADPVAPPVVASDVASPQEEVPEPSRNGPATKKSVDETKKAKKVLESKKIPNVEPEPKPPDIDRPEPKPPKVDPEMEGAPMPRGWSIVTEGGEERRQEGLPALVINKWGGLSGCVGGAKELRLVVVKGGKITGVTPAACSGVLLQQTLAEVQEAATVIVKLR